MFRVKHPNVIMKAKKKPPTNTVFSQYQFYTKQKKRFSTIILHRMICNTFIENTIYYILSRYCFILSLNSVEELIFYVLHFFLRFIRKAH